MFHMKDWMVLNLNTDHATFLEISTLPATSKAIGMYSSFVECPTLEGLATSIFCRPFSHKLRHATYPGETSMKALLYFLVLNSL